MESSQAPRPERTTSESLLGDGETLLIEHGGETYQLRATESGGLVLTRWVGPARSSRTGLYGRIWAGR